MLLTVSVDLTTCPNAETKTRIAGTFFRWVDLCRTDGARESSGEPLPQSRLLARAQDPLQSEGIRSFIGLAVTS